MNGPRVFVKEFVESIERKMNVPRRCISYRKKYNLLLVHLQIQIYVAKLITRFRNYVYSDGE